MLVFASSFGNYSSESPRKNINKRIINRSKYKITHKHSRNYYKKKSYRLLSLSLGKNLEINSYGHLTVMIFLKLTYQH
jgi:hypothetical protein